MKLLRILASYFVRSKRFNVSIGDSFRFKNGLGWDMEGMVTTIKEDKVRLVVKQGYSTMSFWVTKEKLKTYQRITPL